MNLRHRGSYLCTAAVSIEMAGIVTESENNSAETESVSENNSAVLEKMKYHSLPQICQT